jgi:hypothetical protein
MTAPHFNSTEFWQAEFHRTGPMREIVDDFEPEAERAARVAKVNALARKLGNEARHRRTFDDAIHDAPDRQGADGCWIIPAIAAGLALTAIGIVAAII